MLCLPPGILNYPANDDDDDAGDDDAITITLTRTGGSEKYMQVWYDLAVEAMYSSPPHASVVRTVDRYPCTHPQYLSKYMPSPALVCPSA